MTSELTLRPAELRDAELLLRWRNEPVTRAHSFDQREIDPPSHRTWLAAKLAAVHEARLFVLEQGEMPIGQARVDVVGHRLGEISVSVDPEYRGLGVGRTLIELATARGAQELRLDAIDARIRCTNTGSRRAFSAAGYEPHTRAHVGEADVVVLRWTRRPSGGVAE